MGIIITPQLATKLQVLLTEADRQEANLAKKLSSYYIKNPELSSKLFQATKWNDSNSNGHNPNVKIIKQYYHYLTSGNGDWIVNHILNETVDTLSEDKQEYIKQIAMDKGFQEVIRQLKTNTILKQFSVTEGDKGLYGSYAGGNKAEANTFANIIKNIANKNLGSGIKISNTSPHEFKNSILYDIEMTVDNFPFNMEVKAGIANDYNRSSFKFGTFSSNSLGGGINSNGRRLHDDTYASLLPLIGQTAQELVVAIYRNGVTDKIIERYAVNSALAYLEWRIREAQYPIFVNEKNINTCSEIIRGLLNGKGYVDYESYKLKLDNTRDAITLYQTSPFIDFMNDEIRTIQAEALKKAFKENRLTPQFKSTVWYGKK